MIYLLRHGEVEGASTRRFIGHLDVPLSAEGERQCAVQAERLRATKLTAVFSSDLGRSRRSAEIIGAPHGPGLLDLLTRDDLDFADALVKTNIEKLSLLPAGTRHRRSTELLASEQMASLLREIASRYRDRIIIFDSPPLLATTEARVLATNMGQIVMVVAADATSQHAVNQALATIEGCEIVLMVLNKASRTDVGTYYGYYAADDGR